VERKETFKDLVQISYWKILSCFVLVESDDEKSNLFCVDWCSESITKQKQITVALLLIGGEHTVIARGCNADQALQVFVIFL